MVKLFMFYIGGDLPRSNVELHDVRFSVGETAEECYEDLRRQWWGVPKSLHLDCWGAVEQADGFDVTIGQEMPSDSDGKLFLVNLGGYHPSEFSELHKNILLVEVDARKAKAKAEAHIQHWSMPHKDNLFDVEKMTDVTSLLQRNGYSLNLTKSITEKPLQFITRYVPIA